MHDKTCPMDRLSLIYSFILSSPETQHSLQSIQRHKVHHFIHKRVARVQGADQHRFIRSHDMKHHFDLIIYLYSIEFDGPVWKNITILKPPFVATENWK